MTEPLTQRPLAVHTGYGENFDWRLAVDQALCELNVTTCDVAILFCAHDFGKDCPELAQQIWTRLGAPIVFGATGGTLLVDDVEREQTPAVAIMAIDLPGATIAAARVTNLTLEHAPDAASLRSRLQALPEEINGWIVLANPFRFDTGALVDRLADAYPHATIVGGLTSPDSSSRQSTLILNTDAFADGAILLGIGGPYHLFPVLSHGSDPIGQPWTITGVENEWITTVAGQPALSVIDETLRDVPAELRDSTRANLLVGFAVDEYISDFVRSDFMVRAITGIDIASGAISAGYLPRVGQTIQFQLRDPATADLDLTLCLDGARLELTTRRPVAALSFVSNTRGAAFFGAPNHDSALLYRKFPRVPMIGVATSAEIGTAADRSIVNTGGLALGLIYQRA